MLCLARAACKPRVCESLDHSNSLAPAMSTNFTLPARPAPQRPATPFDLRSRLLAAGVHLALSAGVAGLAALLVFGLWYPMPYREISGGRELFFIVVAVDVVLGPLITFAVFDRRKPRSELVRDLAVVCALQLAGLGYGLYTSYTVRPVVAALEVDRLRVVRAIDLAEADLSLAPAEWRQLPWRGVHLLATRKPSPSEQLEAIDFALAGVDLGMRPQFWLPAERTAALMAQAGKPLAELQRRHPSRSAELAKYVAATGLPAEQLEFLPMMSRSTDWVALIDTNGSVVGHAPFDGF